MMENKQKRLSFFTFSAYRAVLFCGFLGIILFAYFLGPMMYRYYVGTGNAFNYEGGNLAVHYLDVGQGDAIIIQLPDGRIIMIDSGTEYYYVRVKTYLKTRVLKGDNNKIDYLIATHSHEDHVGGFAKVLADFDVDTVYRPHNKSMSSFDTGPLLGEAKGQLADTKVYADFISAAYDLSNEVFFIEAGIEIAAAGYSMYFHTPTLQCIGSLAADFDGYNDISPIISLLYKSNLFLFTGDAGLKTENQFRDDSRAISIANNLGFESLDVYLKVGHHGSNGGTTNNFLEFVKPNKAVISVGQKNLYKHPDADVIDRLKTTAGLRDGDILETKEFGNIVVATDGTSEQMFFAFDNEVDLSLVYVISGFTLFFICFTNFKIVKHF